MYLTYVTFAMLVLNLTRNRGKNCSCRKCYGCDGLDQASFDISFHRPL